MDKGAVQIESGRVRTGALKQRGDTATACRKQWISEPVKSNPDAQKKSPTLAGGAVCCQEKYLNLI